MRMRKKPNLLPRMERAAAVLIPEPERLRGKWRTEFPGYERLEVELGCGKGRFTAETAAAEPSTLLVAVEKVPDAMVVAMERAVENGLHNVKFIDRDVVLLPEMFAPGEVDGIYLNFCDPWPKSRDASCRSAGRSASRRTTCRCLRGRWNSSLPRAGRSARSQTTCTPAACAAS